MNLNSETVEALYSQTPFIGGLWPNGWKLPVILEGLTKESVGMYTSGSDLKV